MGKQHANHLDMVIKKYYNITEDWTGKNMQEYTLHETTTTEHEEAQWTGIYNSSAKNMTTQTPESHNSLPMRTDPSNMEPIQKSLLQKTQESL